MRRFLFFIILFFSTLFIFGGQTMAQERYATCDLCGYCPPSEKPANWDSCSTCLYNSGETLKIDPSTNLPPAPIAGRWYTMIGCIRTDGGFQRDGAAASLIQVLLDLIFKAAGGISIVYFIYGSFLVMTSQAEPEKINHGKSIIIGAVVGLLISFGSVFLVNLLASGVLKIPGFGGAAGP